MCSSRDVVPGRVWELSLRVLTAAIKKNNQQRAPLSHNTLLGQHLLLDPEGHSGASGWPRDQGQCCVPVPGRGGHPEQRIGPGLG